MDRHRLAEERSLAYHRVVAARLLSQPDLVEGARTRVRAWLSKQVLAPFYAREWARILEGPVTEIARFLADDGEHARELRQSTPFAGVIGPRERWRIWREVGGRATPSP